MLPDEAGRAGHAVHIEKLKRALGMNADALILGVVAVSVQAVHAQKPAVLSVKNAEHTDLRILQLLVGARHVVRDGADRAGLAERHVVLFARDRMRADEQAVIVLAVEVLEHLALAAAGSALVHEDDLVLIRRFEHCRTRVAADPALLLADVEQNGEHALLRAGTGIEIIGKDLVQHLGAVVDHDLLAVKMRVAERRRNIDDRARGVALGNVGNAGEALHVGKRQGKERRVRRADHQTGTAVGAVAGRERQEQHLLRGKPVERFLAQLGKLIAEAVLEARLVRGQVIADRHAVWVAAAHIVLHEVDDGTVLAAHDLGLLHGADALDRVNDIIAGGVRGTVHHLLELLLGFRIGNAPAFFQCRGDVVGKVESCKIIIRKHSRIPPRAASVIPV